jgi:hypothetical protein
MKKVALISLKIIQEANTHNFVPNCGSIWLANGFGTKPKLQQDPEKGLVSSTANLLLQVT